MRSQYSRERSGSSATLAPSAAEAMEAASDADRATLDEHRDLWTQEPADHRYRGDASRLTSDERALYEDLLSDRNGEGVRLEQERVGFGWLMRALGDLSQGS